LADWDNEVNRVSQIEAASLLGMPNVDQDAKNQGC